VQTGETGCISGAWEFWNFSHESGSGRILKGLAQTGGGKGIVPGCGSGNQDMLIIRVELHSAVTGKVTEIARMLMYNDGTGDVKMGNYKGKTVPGKTEGPMIPQTIHQRRPMRSAEVKLYPRTRLNVWHLVRRMLDNMGYE
jgi:hypothetical protein